MKVQLSTTETEYRSLLKAFNESRKGSTTIKIGRAALWKLLQDHGKMNGALSRQGSPAECPQ